MLFAIGPVKGMAMGSREQRQRQEELWVATLALARPASHPFYDRLNRLLDECQFDEFVESLSKPFYAKTLGRPGLTPGIYFRLLMVGYFEGIDSERGMAWRAADSLGIRAFLRIALDEIAPDHSTISRTRRLIDVETHRLVFVWLLEILAEQGLLRGRTIGIDATTLEANAALRSMVRRDTGEQYEEFLRRLAQESGIETPALNRSITDIISPRGGIAWDPTGNGVWSVRAGAGVFHNWPTLANMQEQYRGNPPGPIYPTFLAGTATPPLLSIGTNNTTPPFGF